MRIWPLLAFLLLPLAQANWMDTAWQYRVPITVSNGGSALADYQLAVNLANLAYDNTGLVGSWHFSEGNGTRVLDSSGNGNNGGIFPGTPKSCSQIYAQNPDAPSGLYLVDPDGAGAAAPFAAYCDMVTEGGGWTLVLLNSPYPTPPTPTWSNAVSAININGNIYGGLTAFDGLVGVSYWNLLGNKMRAEVGSGPAAISHRAVFDFSLNPSNYYAISLSNPSIIVGGNLPGLYSYHNGRPLTTYDADHDAYTSNCAATYGNTAWWFGACWDGSFWGGGGAGSYQSAPYWTGSTTDYYAWGAIWVKDTNAVANASNIRAPGKFGGGLSFDGANSYAEVPASNSLNVSGDLTIEAWVKKNTISDDKGFVVSKAAINNTRFAYALFYGRDTTAGGIGTSGRINFMVYDRANDKLGYAIGYAYDTNQHHVAAVWNGATKTGKLYVDGVDVTESTGAESGFVSVGASPDPLVMGKGRGYNTYPWDYFDGTVDEVRIYNRSLSAQEIQQLYGASKLRLDYADLRFANSSDSALGYWLESDNSAWVRMPSLAANSTTTVYAYYGNPNATSAGNLTATFGTSNATSAIPGCTLGQACILAANWTISSSGTYGHPYVRINPGVTLRINGSGTVAYLEGIGRLDVYGSLVSTGGGTQSTGLSGSGGTGYCGSGQVAPGNGGTYWGNASGGNGGSGSYGPNSGGGGAGGTNGGGGGGGGGNGQCGCSGGSAGANYGGGGGYGGSANCGSSSGGGKGAFLSIKSPNVYVSGTINLTADNGRYNEGSGGEGGGGGALLELNASAFSLYGNISVKAGEGSYGHNQGAGAGGGALAFLNYGTVKGNGQINATAGSTGTTAWGAAGGGNAILALPTGTQPGAASGTAGGSANRSLAAGGSEPYGTLLQEQQFSPFASLGISPLNKTTYPNYPEAFALSITNLQNFTDGFLLSCSGTCAYSANPVSIGSNQSASVNVTITSANFSGTTAYTVTATSQSNASNSASVSASLTVDTTRWRDNWTDAYGNGFRYRVPIAISNNGSALTDYQVNIIIDTSTPIGLSRMRSDCGDIRIMNGTNELPYWVESGCNTTSAKIWVKDSYVPNGSSTIYAYYGNPSAASASNGSNTFTQWHGNATSAFKEPNIFRIPYRWRAKIRTISTSSYYAEFGVGSTSVAGCSDGDKACMEPSQGNSYYITANDGSISYTFTTNPYPSTGYYYPEIIATSSLVSFFFNAGSTEYTRNSNIPSGDDMGLFITGTLNNIQMEWSFVRKYASPEPSASAGAEQSKGYRTLVRRCGAKQPGANVTAYRPPGVVSGNCTADANGICPLEIGAGTYDLLLRFADNSTAWRNGTAFG